MKLSLIISLFLLMSWPVSEVFAGESIINPELMNHAVCSEPYFPSDEELSRELSREPGSDISHEMNHDASHETPYESTRESTHEYVKNADEYLDVLKKIPTSEPTLTRSWIEYKILHNE